MKTHRNRNLTLVLTDAPADPPDRDLISELDDLVRAAADGDPDAVGAIAIAFSPMLLESARIELGGAREGEAANVLGHFYDELLAATLRFPRIRGAALPWMRRQVRDLARAHHERDDWDLAG